MGIFNMLDNIAESLAEKVRHSKINGPTFFNADDEDNRIEILKDLLNRVGDDQRNLIENEIKLIEIGAKGEANVIYELKHSKENMIILHDITLKDSYRDSQIDFLIITKKAIFVLETKKLSGDIEVNSDGEFIRHYKNAAGKVYKKEGIYSPITQNQYHIDAVRDLLLENKLIKSLPFYSYVVIANPKSIINKTYAKKEIKEKIIKYDQINYNIENILKEKSEYDITDSRMLEIATLIVKSNEPRVYDYVSKFKLKLIDDDKVEEDIKIIETTEEVTSDDKLYEELKKYRYNKALELNYKPYYIFNDKELGDLVLNRPKSKEDLIKLPGFGEGKFNLYGNDIINIILADDGALKSTLTDNELLIRKLKSFRMKQSTLLSLKPYLIYNNAEMEDLIAKMPKTKEELLKVKGFSLKKVNEFGLELLEVLNS